MTGVLLDSGTFPFNNGAAGHSCDLNAPPAAGQVDVLCINSNTTISSVVDPSGGAAWVLAPTSVGSQGSYIYRRTATGGEGQTVTITTNGNHNTIGSWSRWANLVAKDTDAVTPVDGVAATATPAHSTGVMAATDELVIAFGALHGLGGIPPANPIWAAPYTPLTAAAQGAGGDGVVAYVGYHDTAGPAAEAPSVSWTNSASDRYMLTLSFTSTTDNIASEGTAAAAASGSGESTVPAPLTALNFFGVVTGIGQCAADGLEVDSIGGLPCRVCLAVPGAIAADHCDCVCGDDPTRSGQLAVTVSRIYPSTTFPNADAETSRTNRCGAPYLIAEIHVQVHRCVPGIDADGNPPTCDDLIAAAEVWHSDAAAIRKAVGCCVIEMKAAGTIRDFVVGETLALGPEGNCAGSDLRVLVAIPHCRCPS